ncbi:Translin-1 [Lithohypha guttulata]|nr:Translin-1 [Lithohypha guttulata]
MTTNGAPYAGLSLIDTSIFTTLQSKIDEESTVRDELKEIVDKLSKQGRTTQSILSRIHNVPSQSVGTEVLDPCMKALEEQRNSVSSLAEAASKFPFYKYNFVWQREIQNVVSSFQLWHWLSSGKLKSIEEVGEYFRGEFAILFTPTVPVNVKDADTFHITIEDYLLALCSTIEELARLATNSVTLGDHARPLQISKFIKDVYAGFQLLNLKNDALRKRSDGIKYSIRNVEGVVYDLSLRGLVPKDEDTMKME